MFRKADAAGFFSVAADVSLLPEKVLNENSSSCVLSVSAPLPGGEYTSVTAPRKGMFRLKTVKNAIVRFAHIILSVGGSLSVMREIRKIRNHFDRTLRMRTPRLVRSNALILRL